MTEKVLLLSFLEDIVDNDYIVPGMDYDDKWIAMIDIIETDENPARNGAYCAFDTSALENNDSASQTMILTDLINHFGLGKEEIVIVHVFW